MADAHTLLLQIRADLANLRADVADLAVEVSRIVSTDRAMSRNIASIQSKEIAMSAELDALTAQVQQNNDLADSAITLIQGLAAQIEALKDDPAALQALVDSLRAEDQKLSDALAANTPAQP